MKEPSVGKRQKKGHEMLWVWQPMERVTGIGPARPAWKAGVLPLNYTRVLEGGG